MARRRRRGRASAPRKSVLKPRPRRALYDDPQTLRIARESAIVEAEGYCKWTRVEEIVQFARRMGYPKLAKTNEPAFCYA